MYLVLKLPYVSLLSETLILLLVCITGAKSWQDSIETVDEHSAENTECLREKHVDNDGTEATCKKSVVIREEGECSASEGATHDETDCGTLVDEEDDQSALLMLGQEDQEFSTEGNTAIAPDECPQHTAEEDACEPVDSSLSLPKEEHLDNLADESGDVRPDSLVQNVTHSDLTKEDEGKDVHKSNIDLPKIDESTNEEPQKELEPEHENVPLREILLKLKVSIIAYSHKFYSGKLH